MSATALNGDDPHPIIMANRLGQWLLGAVVCDIVLVGMMQYHAWWRAKPWSWGTANECLALAAYAGLALCLAVGPLRRLGLLGASLVHLRRPLAIAGAVAAGLHVAVALLAAPGVGWVLKHPWSFTIGAVAGCTLVALAATSWPSALHRLGAERWRNLHLLAAPTLAAITLHVLVLGKVDKWASWWISRDLPLPPGTLPMAIIGTAVLGLRCLDSLRTCRHSPRRALADGGAFLAVAGFLTWAIFALPPIAAPLPAAPPPAVPAPAAVPTPAPAAELIVLCGTSMKAPTEAMVATARTSGLAVRLDFGGSETLLPRVLAGERADLLVVHDPFPDKLAAAGRLQRSVAVGCLVPVLAVPAGNPRRLSGLSDLAQEGVRVGLPDARYSTCGEYVRARLREQGIESAVQSRVVVEQRSHQELATALRLGSIDAAVLWNFIGAQQTEHIQILPLPGPWPDTRVRLCVLTGAASVVDRLLAAEPDLPGLFGRHGFAAPLP
jgi:ABC-type molybdate transport system substrate-binding protein/DMSO/TMAO reductase YedYZ heme-binding membrane subunit